MFSGDEVIEFFNRIINADDLKPSEIKNNVTKFYEYLVLTKMCDAESLKSLSVVITCLNEIIALKKAFGYIDISTLLLEPEEQKKLIKKVKKNRHYSNYEINERFAYSGNCGVSVSRC